MLKTQPRGTSDTSRIATDHINNPNSINPIFELGARACARWSITAIATAHSTARFSASPRSDRMRSRTLTLRDRFLSFLNREPPTGPGRVDTFSPPKVLFNFPMEKLPQEEWIGTCDLPSI